MLIVWAGKRWIETERRRKKNRDNTAVSWKPQDHHRPILPSETTLCLTSVLLQTPVTEETSPKPLTSGESWKTDDDDVNPRSWAAFLSTSCLPSVSACVSGSLGKHLPLCSLGEAGHCSECQQQAYCHQTPLARPYKDRPLPGSHLWEKPGRGGEGKNRNRKGGDEMVKEWQRRVT